MNETHQMLKGTSAVRTDRAAAVCVCGRPANRRVDGWPHICITLYTQQTDCVCGCMCVHARVCVCWGLQRTQLRQKRLSKPTWDISHPFNQLDSNKYPTSLFKMFSALQIHNLKCRMKCYERHFKGANVVTGELSWLVMLVSWRL